MVTHRHPATGCFGIFGTCEGTLNKCHQMSLVAQCSLCFPVVELATETQWRSTARPESDAICLSFPKELMIRACGRIKLSRAWNTTEVAIKLSSRSHQGPIVPCFMNPMCSPRAPGSPPTTTPMVCVCLGCHRRQLFTYLIPAYRCIRTKGYISIVTVVISLALAQSTTHKHLYMLMCAYV